MFFVLFFSVIYNLIEISIAASGKRRLIVADFMECLGNGQPPWAAYQSIMSFQMIILDNKPGVMPVGVGETWQWPMLKCVLRVIVKEAEAACRAGQLDGGV